jgi:hypothetical protein
MSSRHSLTQQRLSNSDEEAHPTSHLLKYEGRQPFRTRFRRVMFLLCAIAIVCIVLFSKQHGYAEHAPYQAPLSPTSLVPKLPENLPPSTITIMAPPSIQTLIVEPSVEPVVFALIMYSEPSAKEGAVLLKVRS